MNQTKKSFYRSDGSGRDFYISYNSGGIWSGMKPIRSIKAVNWATYIPDYACDRKMTNPYPKYSHYYGDGTGRDNYIINGNGGLSHERPRTKISLRSQTSDNKPIIASRPILHRVQSSMGGRKLDSLLTTPKGQRYLINPMQRSKTRPTLGLAMNTQRPSTSVFCSPKSFVLAGFDGMLKNMSILEKSGRFRSLGIRKRAAN